MKKFTDINKHDKEPELSLKEKIEKALNTILVVEYNASTEENVQSASIKNIDEVAERMEFFITHITESARAKAIVDSELSLLEGRHYTSDSTKIKEYYKVNLNSVDSSIRELVEKQIEAGNGYIQVYKSNETSAHIYGANTDSYLYTNIIIPVSSLIKA